MLADKFLLVVDDILKSLKLLFLGLCTIHTTVVNASHTDGEHIVSAILHLVKTLRPVFLYVLLIGKVIELPLSEGVPFAYVVSEKRLTM